MLFHTWHSIMITYMSKSQDDKHLCSPNEDFGWPDKHSMVPKRRFCKAEQTFGNVFSKNFFTYVSLSITGRCCHYISAVFRSVRTSHMTRLCPKQHNTSTVLKIIHTSRVNGVRARLFETIFKGSRTIVMLSPWTHAPARLTRTHDSPFTRLIRCSSTDKNAIILWF